MTVGEETLDRSPSERVDVCVLGAGVAGALVAHSLAERGHDVVVLEAGERFAPESRLERMERAIRPEHSPLDIWNMGGSRDAYTSSGDSHLPLNRGRVKGVGGTTLHWMGLIHRLHEKDFEMRSRYGVGRDWPISYDDLRPYYARAETELGAAGAQDNPFGPPREEAYPMEAFPPSYADSLLGEACEALDIAVHSIPQARNSEAYDGRSPCQGYSTCIPVCPSGAKYSGDVHIRKAEREGARIVDRAPVQRLVHDEAGDRVESAVYATPDGEAHSQEARHFVLACGAVENTRLLLLSASRQYRDGLANTSGCVGRYFMEHSLISLAGRIDRSTGSAPIGFHTTETQQFYEPENPPPGSIRLEFQNVSPPSLVEPALRGGDAGTAADLMDPLRGDKWGDELFDDMRDQYARNVLRTGAVVENLPRKESTVTLDRDRTDPNGNPVPEISWSPGAYERESFDRAWDLQERILEETGAEVTGRRGPGSTGHHMGTTRMGADPDESVVDPRLRTHDVENLSIASSSVFVTCGALNPTLTIAALSLKAADHVDRDL